MPWILTLLVNFLEKTLRSLKIKHIKKTINCNKEKNIQKKYYSNTLYIQIDLNVMIRQDNNPFLSCSKLKKDQLKNVKNKGAS